MKKYKFKHPAFKDVVVEVDGKQTADEYVEQGWIEVTKPKRKSAGNQQDTETTKTETPSLATDEETNITHNPKED